MLSTNTCTLYIKVTLELKVQGQKRMLNLNTNEKKTEVDKLNKKYYQR